VQSEDQHWLPAHSQLTDIVRQPQKKRRESICNYDIYIYIFILENGVPDLEKAQSKHVQ
jgi:NRPS condensation-like uncharacterized protein